MKTTQNIHNRNQWYPCFISRGLGYVMFNHDM